MVDKKASLKNIDRHVSNHYFQKATEFYKTMKVAQENHHWNSVGLNGVHCVISSCDALLAHFGGIRSTSQDHSNSAELLKKYIFDVNLKNNIQRFQKVVRQKNIIEYEGRLFTGKEASDIELQTMRFYDWTKVLLKK